MTTPEGSFATPKTELTPEAIEKLNLKRKKYLRAMALSLGSPELLADIVSAGLITEEAQRGIQEKILSQLPADSGCEREDLPPNVTKEIEQLGKLFASSTNYESFKFSFGLWVASLAAGDLDKNITHLADWINRWEGDQKKFLELIQDDA